MSGSEGGSRRRAAVSLSPMKYRSARITTPEPSRSSSRRERSSATPLDTPAKLPNCSLAMNDTETVLVSANGDVLVCRCRETSTPYVTDMTIARRTKDSLNLSLWWDSECDTLTSKLGEAMLSSPCCGNQRPPTATLSKGLRGGSSMRLGDEKVFMLMDPLRGLQGGAPPPNKNAVTSCAEEKKEDDTGVVKGPDRDFFLTNLLEDDNDQLFPLPSFDYSHFAEGGNDMLPSAGSSKNLDQTNDNLAVVSENSEPVGDSAGSKAARNASPWTNDDFHRSEASQLPWHDGLWVPDFLHGVPVFHPAFNQIRITQVSAHPLGSHVLLISKEALLFSYGLNNHGQLGNGQRAKGSSRSFITSPIIVTPLLENGGKALTCAAGKSHSLVVVMTEGRRVGRSKPHRSAKVRDSASDAAFEMSKRQTAAPGLQAETKAELEEPDSMLHHQLYGFGSNKYMKLGLLNPKLGRRHGDDQEDVLLPRRVALHCNVWPDRRDSGSSASYGIFQISASTNHSAALVRRATGDIELYTWGNATNGALGVSSPQVDNEAILPNLDQDCLNPAIQKMNPVASRKDASEKSHKVKPTSKTIVPIPTLVTGLSYLPGWDLGAGICKVQSSEFPTCVSLGPDCTFVVTSRGRCFSFGTSEEGMLGQGPGVANAFEPKEIVCSSSCNRLNSNAKIKSVSVGARHVIAQATDGSAFAWGRLNYSDADFCSEFENVTWRPERLLVPLKSTYAKHKAPPPGDKKSRPKIAKVCAGLDSTVLVLETGEVLSFGRKSGQLGLGELSNDVPLPRPMLGGLRLWHRQAKQVPKKDHK